MTQNSVSFSCQNYPVSRCCINFPHQLTCQILTNQTMKIVGRSWPTSDHGERSQNLFPTCNSSLNRVQGQFEIKILIVRHINTTYFIWACDHLKTRKKILNLDGSTPEPAIRSGDTGQWISCFDSCQLITTLMCNMQYQFAPGLPN